MRRDVAELERLVRVLGRHAPPDPATGRRELQLIAADLSAGAAEQRLRAITALLLTMETYLRVTRRVDGSPAASRASSHADAGPPSADGVGPVDDELARVAAAGARYIARDLAARRLSEFTSAEGYRLARELARIGGTEEAVEHLLAEANQVRLHPMPLAEALSHSARGA